MKYLCLLFNDEKKLDGMPKSEWDTLVAGRSASRGRSRSGGFSNDDWASYWTGGASNAFGNIPLEQASSLLQKIG